MKEHERVWQGMMWVKHGVTPIFAKTVKIDPRFYCIYPNIPKLSKNIHIHSLSQSSFSMEILKVWEYIFFAGIFVCTVCRKRSVKFGAIYLYLNQQERVYYFE